MTKEIMNILSRIIKELAQEFRISDSVNKNLLQRIFLTSRNKQNKTMEKIEDGRIKRLGDKSTER